MRMTATEREAYARGRKCFDRGDTDRALSAFSQLLSTRSDFADVHYMVGVLHEHKGNSQAAVDSLRQAIRLNPSYAEALLALASVHERAGDFDRSQALTERAAEANPVQHGLDATTRGKLANLQAALGDAYAEVGEMRSAIEAYRKALDRCPDYLDIRYRLGVALREVGLPHKAEQEFRRVQRGNPKFLDAGIQLGLTHYSLGRIDEALGEWKRVSEQDSTRQDALMYIRLVESGQDPIQTEV